MFNSSSLRNSNVLNAWTIVFGFIGNSLINLFIILPWTRQLMYKRHKLEREEGKSYTDANVRHNHLPCVSVLNICDPGIVRDEESHFPVRCRSRHLFSRCMSISKINGINHEKVIRQLTCHSELGISRRPYVSFCLARNLRFLDIDGICSIVGRIILCNSYAHRQTILANCVESDRGKS